MIRIESADHGVVVWTIDRPPANAISADLIDAFEQAAKAAEADDAVRAVILRGNEKFFSAGLDLKDMAAGGAARVMDFGWGDGVAALWTLSKPTVAEVAGHAIAGGAILALACDVRVASTSPKKIGLNETAIGLSFPRGAFEIARHGLPQARFGRTILEGDLFGPEAALEIGYVHELVAPEALSGRALEVAKKLAFLPKRAYADNKRLWQEPCVRRCESESEDVREARRALWKSGEIAGAFQARSSATSKDD